MSDLIRSARARLAREDGFTLIELLITSVILGIIAFGLVGVVIRYLQDTAETQARFSESHDVQFTATYWQRDVASIGVRSPTYDDATHSYPLLQSVNVTPACSFPGAVIGTLAWTEYDRALDGTPSASQKTVSYVVTGSGPYTLSRVRCSGSTVVSTLQLANKLSASPVMACAGPGGTSCTGAGPNVPTLITLTLTARDPGARRSAAYSAVLTGERRQT